MTRTLALIAVALLMVGACAGSVEPTQQPTTGTAAPTPSATPRPQGCVISTVVADGSTVVMSYSGIPEEDCLAMIAPLTECSTCGPPARLVSPPPGNPTCGPLVDPSFGWIVRQWGTSPLAVELCASLKRMDAAPSS